MAFLQINSGVRICWALEEPKGPKGPEEVAGRAHRERGSGALYQTHIIAPRSPNPYGVIRDKL